MAGNRWMLLRGLARGNGHWGHFPKMLQAADPNIEIEFNEIPGNGTRFRETTPFDSPEVINIIRTQSKFRQAGRPFNLCGISLGGMVALDWAQRFPEDLVSVAVINTSLAQYSPFYRRMNLRNLFRILLSQLASSPLQREEAILRIVSNSREQRHKFVHEFAKFSSENPVSMLNVLRQMILANKIVLGGSLKVPVKVIVSDFDRLVHPSCSTAMASQLGVKLFRHLGSGHDLPLDDPKWLCEILLQNPTPGR